MKDAAAFNVNRFVSVMVKPEGFAYWKAQEDAILPVQWHRPLEEYQAKAAGADGRVLMQLHEFMRVFGGIAFGCPVPYETDIWLSAAELSPPKVFAVCRGGSGYVDASE